MKRKTMLKASIRLAAVVFILSACMLDSESIIPMITCGASAGWLCFIAIVNTL